MELNNFCFWELIPKPILALSPMDGVTDAVFRRLVARYGKPDIIVTEFTSVEGVCHGAERELSGLIYHESERPVVAQIYGHDPYDYFLVAQLVCELGFDGLDINMGCPAKSVSSRGCGAGLIKDPERAKDILRATQRGIREWADGAAPEIFKVHKNIRQWFQNRKQNGWISVPEVRRRIIPVSAKTRLGIDKNMIEDWVKHLLEVQPSAITIHGRTLTQGYKGAADWDAIAAAVKIAKGSGTLILGNGDIKSLKDVYQRVQQTGVDGVLIGRAVLGDPWFFQNKDMVKVALKEGRESVISEDAISYVQKLNVALEHAQIFEDEGGVARFPAVRKHLDRYCRGFHGAAELRSKLVRSKSAQEVGVMLAPYLYELSV